MLLVRYLLGTEDHYFTSPLSVRDRGRYLLGIEVTSPLSVRDRGY